MTAFAFNALGFCKALQLGGFSQEQAETLTEQQQIVMDDMLNSQELATKGDIVALKGDITALKGDIREVELRLQKEIEKVRADMRVEIQQVKYDMLKWQFGIAAVLGTIMAKGFGWIGF